MAGIEVVQVYMHDVIASVIRPVKQLIAFTRVELQPGETKTVSIQLKKEDFQLVNREEKYVVEPGEFELFIGHSSKRTDLKKLTFVLHEDDTITLSAQAAAVAPALTQEYLEYFLQENWGVSIPQWIASFPKPGDIINILQILMTKKPAIEAVTEAIRETMDTRGTCKRKLEKLVE